MKNNERLYALEPDDYGYWGEATIVENQAEITSGEARVPQISFLEYELEGWQGDELLADHACFIVSELLARDLRDAGATGAEFADLLISKSLNFPIVCPGITLPRFERLIPRGTVTVVAKDGVSNWSGQDVCFADWWSVKVINENGNAVPPSFELVVTERCLDVILKHNIKHCKVMPLTCVTSEPT
jgi:hypothetical protein